MTVKRPDEFGDRMKLTHDTSSRYSQLIQNGNIEEVLQ